MTKVADLHIHSHFSDSTFSLEEIFSRAKSEHLSCISITDHDTLDAYPQAEELAYKHNIELLKGVEFSSHLEGEEIHILAYFLNGADSKFLDILAQVKEERRNRIMVMAERLSELGLILDLDDLAKYLGQASVSRMHLAHYLKDRKKVSDIKTAFSKYIGVDSPVYSGKFRYQTQEAIGLLQESGAKTFLAHPLNLSSPALVEKIIGWGIDGIEVFYPTHSSEVINELLDLTQRRHLLVSGGSDCHGLAKKYIGIGRIRLDYCYVEKIKNAF